MVCFKPCASQICICWGALLMESGGRNRPEGLGRGPFRHLSKRPGNTGAIKKKKQQPSIQSACYKYCRVAVDHTCVVQNMEKVLASTDSTDCSVCSCYFGFLFCSSAAGWQLTLRCHNFARQGFFGHLRASVFDIFLQFDGHSNYLTYSLRYAAACAVAERCK